MKTSHRAISKAKSKLSKGLPLKQWERTAISRGAKRLWVNRIAAIKAAQMAILSAVSMMQIAAIQAQPRPIDLDREEFKKLQVIRIAECIINNGVAVSKVLAQ